MTATQEIGAATRQRPTPRHQEQESMMQPQPTPQRLRRLPRGEDGESRYIHPNGWVIVSARRTWSERVGRMHGQADWPSPLRWWEIYRHYSQIKEEAHPMGRQVRGGTFDTLRDARAWCDEHIPGLKGEPVHV